jgi:hypothetical protein
MNPYVFYITLGGALALILSVVSAAAPVITKGVLPLGGTDFKQTAIVMLSAIACAIIVDLWQKIAKSDD